MPSEQDLDDEHDEVFRRENGQQKGQQGCSGGGGKAAYIVQSERYRTHLSHQSVAIAKIGERLDIARSEEFPGRNLAEEDPLLFEALDVALSEETIVGQALSSCMSQAGCKHQQWAENRQHEEDNGADDLCLERQ